MQETKPSEGKSLFDELTTTTPYIVACKPILISKDSRTGNLQKFNIPNSDTPVIKNV